MPNEKKIFIFIAAVIISFLSGFFARGVFNRGGVSNAAEYHQAVESLLRNGRRRS
jgi:hypothetical protein